MKATNMKARDEILRVQQDLIKCVPLPAVSDLQVNTEIGFWKVSYPGHYQSSAWRRILWGTLNRLSSHPTGMEGQVFPLTG